MIIKVGKSIKSGYKVPRFVTYADVKYDIDGWADASKFLPIEFDLVYLKIPGKPVVSGWHTGLHWDGIRIKTGEKVSHWKRRFDEEETK